MQNLNDRTFIFNHSGSMGDIFSSLHFVIEYLEDKGASAQQACFNIPLDEPIKSSPYIEGVNIPAATGAFISALLQYMGFQVTHKKKNQLTSYIDLDAFRGLNKINLNGGDLREWYYQAYDRHLPKNFVRKLLEVSPDPSLGLQDKLIVFRTSRYINPLIDWKKLQAFKSRLIFTGFQHEHTAFCNKIFQLPFMPITDALDAAVKFVSAKGVIGNPCGLYHIAELLKVPRIYISTEWNATGGRGPLTTLPIGGWNEVVRVNTHLVPAVESLLGPVPKSNCNSHIDTWLNERVFKGKQNGFYIECGANDGKRDSISYFYEKYFNWRGCLIEPQETLMNKCKQCRNSDNIFIKKGLGICNKQMVFTVPEDNLDNASLCLSKEHYDTLKKAGYGRSFRKELIEVIDYPTLMQQVPGEIDLAIFDVEGGQMDILLSMLSTVADWKKTFPKILVVEYDWSDKQKIISCLSPYYKVLQTFKSDIVFQRHTPWGD